MDQIQNKNVRPRKRKDMEERRAVERHVFSETAEVVDVAGGTRLTGRVADISLEGCYVDTFNPFPLETLVRVKIVKNGAEFLSAGAVRNSQTGMGMGINFAEITGGNRLLLEKWVCNVCGSALSNHSIKPAFAATSLTEASPQSATANTNESLAKRLVDLLHKKGQLSDSDVVDLLSGGSPDDAF